LGRGDTVLIEDNDRFSRERPLDSLIALREIVSRGVEVAFLKTGVIVNKNNFDDPAVLFPNFFQSFLANQKIKNAVSASAPRWPPDAKQWSQAELFQADYRHG
jgi:hypothetical protein